jgi:peroxiredoxin
VRRSGCGSCVGDLTPKTFRRTEAFASARRFIRKKDAAFEAPIIRVTASWNIATRSTTGGLHMRSDIVPGAIFPDYELSDHTGKHRKLSELQGPHPMVLVLSRGGYCPKDRRQHEGLAQLHRELEVGYCRLVTISTDNITETNEFRSGVGAHWPFLSDVRRTIQKDLDIAEYTDPVHNPMIPYTIVLEPGLVIYKVYNGYWFFGRPTIEDLRQDLRAVIRACRPDWDITTPELRAAWQEGRKERFYPYGKTFAQTIGEQD